MAVVNVVGEQERRGREARKKALEVRSVDARSFYGATLRPAPGGSRRGLASCIEIGKCAAEEGVDVFCKVPGRQRGAAEKSVERCFLRGGWVAIGRDTRGRVGGD